MAEENKGFERLVFVQVMRLNATILGVTAGLFFGITIFVATNFLLLKGGEIVGPHLALLGVFFLGYRVTFWGSVLGLLYGFFVGFIAGYLFARLYNWLVWFRDDGHSAYESHHGSID